MEPFVYEAADETATDALGAALAEALPEGAVVALCGTLGAGKTRLAREFAAQALDHLVQHRDTTGYPDGVWMVELASLTDGDVLVESVAKVVLGNDGIAAKPMRNRRSKRSRAALATARCC